MPIQINPGELLERRRRYGDSKRTVPPRYLGLLGRREALRALVVSLAYYLGVKAGFALTFAPEPVALLWPPNAIMLAALLWSRQRSWPLLIAAVLPAHLLAELPQVPLEMALCWFVSNMTEALVGAWGIRRWLGRPPEFTRFRDFVCFLFWGAFMAPFVSSFLDAGFVMAVGHPEVDYGTVWRTRMLSNVLACLTVVPLLVTSVETVMKSARWPTSRQLAEGAVLVGGLSIVSFIVFYEQHSARDGLSALYLPLPFLIWAAMRMGVAGVSVCIAIVAGFAISGLMQGHGVFNTGDARASAMAVQIFLIIVASCLMTQSVSLAELRRTRRVAVSRGERLRLALTAAHMGMWDFDPASNRIVWSRAAEVPSSSDMQRTHFSIDEAMKRVHPDDVARVNAALAQVLAGGHHLDVEFRWRPEQEFRWIVAKGKFTSSPGAPHIVGIYMDITERKLQDQQLQTQRDQLAHLSRAAVLGELSGALAHELNQPLTTIMVNAQAAHRSVKGGLADAAEVEEMLVDIIAEDKRAGDVIRRLRVLFSRGDQEMQSVNVNECIRDVLALEHSDLIARNITAETELAWDLPRVQGDSVQLQQVLLNIIINAGDAMRDSSPGERRLRITTRTAADGSVAIDIADRGTGIDNLDSIFEPFFTTKHHGLGLGLPICRTIIHSHRGQLWATNNATRGATMHIALPAASDRNARHTVATGH